MGSSSSVLLFEYSLLTCPLSEIEFNSKCIINTVNQYSFIIAENDKEFKSALKHADILLPDGVGIVAATKLLTGQNIKKIAGADLHDHLLNDLNKKKGRCFYLGSSVKTLNLIKRKIRLEFPDIVVETYSPPFKKFFSKHENDTIINAINAFGPDVLFVGMTAPKQEKWIYNYGSQLSVNTICSIGAVFDFYAGTIVRPSKFWRNLGLEWFIRLLKEPGRMYKRYLYYGPLFVFKILKSKVEKLRIKSILQSPHDLELNKQ